MLTILNLFGRSPFAPLQTHMKDVSRCVHKLPSLFNALEEQNQALIEQIANEIAEIEHQADIIKNDIRNHLPKGLFLPIDRNQLLEILAIQDHIADRAEDIAILATLKTLTIFPGFKEDFYYFLQKNIETFDGVEMIIQEMNDLVESSFGGIEAQKVRAMVDAVGEKEHEVDLIQRRLLKKLFQSEDSLTYTSFYLWQRILEAVAAISNLSESLANRVRMTLEIK